MLRRKENHQSLVVRKRFVRTADISKIGIGKIGQCYHKRGEPYPKFITETERTKIGRTSGARLKWLNIYL